MLGLGRRIGTSLLRRRTFTSTSSSLAKILCSDPVDPVCSGILEARGHDVDLPPGKDPLPADELESIIHQYDALVVRSGTTVTQQVIDNAHRLKFIGRAGTGVNNIDLGAATRRGVVVMNTPGGNTSSASELTIALLMALSRHVAQASIALRNGVWDRKAYTGSELAGKTIAIVGLGRIGLEVAAGAQGLGMKTIGYDPLMSPEAALKSGIQMFDLDELWSQADFISVHSPLNERTRNLIDARVLESCKRGVRIINCARGGIVNEEALLGALKSGMVGGAALDVYQDEPPKDPTTLELLSHPNVVCTPHLGASTQDAQFRVARDIATYIADALDGSGFTGVVNTSGLEMQSRKDLRPWVDLADRMGQFQSQMAGGKRIKSISLRFRGSVVGDPEVAKLLRTAVLRGIINQLTNTKDANFVNTPVLVESMGLDVTEQVISEGDVTHNNLLSVQLEGDDTEMTRYGGTLVAGLPRVVLYNERPVGVSLNDHILALVNDDKPGVIKRVADFFQAKSIPVSYLSLARNKSLKEAYGFLNIERALTKEETADVEALVGIKSVESASITDNILQRDSGASSAMNPPPPLRPANPNFGSGPTTKYPGWKLENLESAALGRSHRSSLGKAKLKEAIDLSRSVLHVPDDYHIGIVPASDTGAFEMAMWSLLGPQPVDVLHWESFGKGWFSDATQQLKLPEVNEFTAPYGALPELPSNPDHDVLFTWNGTTSGVRVPDASWIDNSGKGLALCDATSAVFAQRVDISKLDVVTYSWQKVLGGEGAHGMIILSPKAVERLESYTPEWPLPKIFRMTKKGKLDTALFEGATINTPSMLCVEDYLLALKWAESHGGLSALIERADRNLAVVEAFVAEHEWIDFLASDPATRSNTSVCLSLDLPKDKIKAMVTLLETEGIAYDIGSYRDAPPGLRIWCGAAVETSDLQALMPWLAWAHAEVTAA